MGKYKKKIIKSMIQEQQNESFFHFQMTTHDKK